MNEIISMGELRDALTSHYLPYFKKIMKDNPFPTCGLPDCKGSGCEECCELARDMYRALKDKLCIID